MTGLNTYLPEAHCNAITRRGESWKLFIIYHSTVINYPQLYTCHEDSKVQCYENLSCLLDLLPKNSLNACFWNIWAMIKRAWHPLSAKSISVSNVTALHKPFLHEGIQQPSPKTVSQASQIPEYPTSLNEILLEGTFLWCQPIFHFICNFRFN